MLLSYVSFCVDQLIRYWLGWILFQLQVCSMSYLALFLFWWWFIFTSSWFSSCPDFSQFLINFWRLEWSLFRLIYIWFFSERYTCRYVSLVRWVIAPLNLIPPPHKSRLNFLSYPRGEHIEIGCHTHPYLQDYLISMGFFRKIHL